MTTRQEVLDWCSETLQPSMFQDYAPNGLQVEGKENIHTIVTAVTASLAAIEYAVSKNADMLLVHHGYFWRSEPITITGWKKLRIATLLQHQINMVGYHLPLDAHSTLGNNAQLAQLLGWKLESLAGEQNLLNIGRLNQPCTLAQLADDLTTKLQHKPIIIGDSNKLLHRIAWCTGGAQNFFQVAIEAGVDVFVTGEISESQYHMAQESGVAFISAGHHATERYGVQALGAALAKRFNMDIYFFDEKNPA